ncbi:cold-shock protein [Labrys sp. KB_33_2]|uniref:cold-shock protein n=1 Tax=Labrys sp. KB_33_2 TaxID=3237479 RepID=UPI003F93687A
MPAGTVKWFDAQKGCGFIKPDDGGPDVFVHIGEVELPGYSELRDGQPISYELITDRKTGKAKAGNIKVL